MPEPGNHWMNLAGLLTESPGGFHQRRPDLQSAFSRQIRFLKPVIAEYFSRRTAPLRAVQFNLGPDFSRRVRRGFWSGIHGRSQQPNSASRLAMLQHHLSPSSRCRSFGGGRRA